MSYEPSGPLAQQEPFKPLRKTTKRVMRFPGATAVSTEEPLQSDADEQSIPIYFNVANIQPDTADEKEQRNNNDAQIAARRAMAKRSSRSFAARASRTRSRKKEKLARQAKPGITLDTSFARHRGNAPRLVYPHDNELRSGGTSKKYGFLGLGRSGTKGKGLGIMKGTTQPDQRGEEIVSKYSTYRINASSDNSFGETRKPSGPARSDEHTNDPKTAESLTPGTKTWMEISPSDRPIVIGISVPSDSVPDFSPYQINRQRSESDATLVTPSIIITPAQAMKSVWSPDTPSDYASARSSTYSHAPFNIHSAVSDVPPVPALPAVVIQADNAKLNSELAREADAGSPAHIRNGTLDSAITAFEEDDDSKRKDRIVSTATMFEEDETPLRDRHLQLSTLSIDTGMTPTPRRSRGWWNVITTPFEFSRTNSVWTQGGRNAVKTPDVPTVPQRFGMSPGSPSTPSTYIWSATDRSASIRGDSPLIPLSLRTAVTTPSVNETAGVEVTAHRLDVQTSQPANGTTKPNDEDLTSKRNTDLAVSNKETSEIKEGRETSDRNVASPLSAMSSSPIVGTAAIGTVLNARQIHEQQHRPVSINVEIHDRRLRPIDETGPTSSPPAIQRTAPSPPQPPATSIETTPVASNVVQRSPPPPAPQFAPPPTFSQKSSHFSYDHDSRSSSPALDKPRKDKTHRKVNVMDWMAMCRRKGKKKQDKEKRKSRRCCCLWSCCCILLLVLLAIIIPVAVVLSKRHNDGSKTKDAPSQWLNLTGYPPIPTGVATIAQPENVEAQSGCVSVPTVWSCAVPKEQQAALSPSQPNQPNFKLDIIFQNGTVSDPSKTRPVRRAANAVSAGAFIRSQLLRLRGTPSASPAPPSIADQQFLGNTTDKNSLPFEGEQTPFFISFLDPSNNASSTHVAKRDSGSDNITNIIPAPSTTANGVAAPANLLPLPSGQPLRLYNRGTDDEHYGFYIYYDRSIFLKSISQNFTNGGVPADANGGSPFDAATMRCTWSQTRFLVQIWTRSQTSKPLLQVSGNATSSDLKRPGTFPYPVTVTLDRHGGEDSGKMIYCYNMDTDGKLLNDDNDKFLVGEDRAFAGVLVNPAQGQNVQVNGTIDGGSGGCGCQWQNFLAS